MFDNIIGQSHVKERLSILIEDAKETGLRLPDLFISGPGGVGKSTFSRSIADEIYGDQVGFFAELNATSAKNLMELITYLHDNERIPFVYDKENDLITAPRCIIFIDEVHKLKEPLKTELLNATDKQRKTTFKAYKDKILMADFTEATFIMATTDKNDLSDAFLSRFQLFELIPYTIEEIAKSVSQMTGWSLDAAMEVGKRAKTVMRVAVLDITGGISPFLRVKKLEPTAENIIRYYRELKKVDDIGLDDVDYKLLEILADSAKPLGLKTIASRMRKPEKEVESREGYLASMNFIDKVAGGRAISNEGLAKLKSKFSTVP